MFRFSLSDPKKFKNAIDGVVNLVDEAILEVKSEGLSLMAMDPSQISMVCFFMPKTAFEDYHTNSDLRVGLNFSNLSKILSRAHPSEKLEIEQEENKIVIRFIGGKKKRAFKLPILDLTQPITREPKINPGAIIKMVSQNFKEQLKDAALVSTHVTLTATENNFKIDAKGESSDLTAEQEKDSEGIISMEVNKEARATFLIEYLDDITKACPENQPLIIYLEKEKPIKIEYTINEAKLVYYLAPRIEND
ncbi:MAG: proliferating cell nuclear antigen (pcna) [Candidatus Anstonellaceae archaeon]